MSEPSPASTRALTARQRFWLEHLQAWQAQEELSLKAYAGAHELSVSALYTAKRWFKAHGLWQGREASVAPRPRATLVPVRVRAPALPQSAATLRVHLPNGIVVEVPEQAEPHRCQALIATLLGGRS